METRISKNQFYLNVGDLVQYTAYFPRRIIMGVIESFTPNGRVVVITGFVNNSNIKKIDLAVAEELDFLCHTSYPQARINFDNRD